MPKANLTDFGKYLFVALLTLICYQPAVAQNTGTPFGEHTRFEVGGCVMIPFGNLKATVGKYDISKNLYLKDTLAETALTAKMGFGLYVGNSFPMRRLGRRSILAFTLAGMYEIYGYEKLNPVVDKDGSITTLPGTPQLDLDVSKLAVPIGLDIKYGTDALCRRRNPIGFTFGLGILPQYNAMKFSAGTTIKDTSSLGFAPYAKAEFSFFANVCIKLKVLASLGNNITLINRETQISPKQTYVFQVVEKGSVTVCLSVLPFSYKWKKAKWWNDYEDHIQYDDFY